MAESKSSKKNRRRRAAAEKKLTPSSKSVGFQIESEDIEPAQKLITDKAEPSLVDPITDLKRQIDEAKNEKDHDKAQELRQKMWVLQDTVLLGRAGPGAPKVDINEMLSQTQAPVKPATHSDDPTEKKLDKLRKKLRQIEALKLKRANGEPLESNQITKIEGESEILEEISILEDLLSGL